MVDDIRHHRPRKGAVANPEHIFLTFHIDTIGKARRDDGLFSLKGAFEVFGLYMHRHVAPLEIFVCRSYIGVPRLITRYYYTLRIG